MTAKIKIFLPAVLLVISLVVIPLIPFFRFQKGFIMPWTDCDQVFPPCPPDMICGGVGGVVCKGTILLERFLIVVAALFIIAPAIAKKLKKEKKA